MLRGPRRGGPLSRDGAGRRGLGLVVVVVAAMAATIGSGGVSAVNAQVIEDGTRLAPPGDNVFPVPLPYEVTFDDTWHACRDGCSRQHKGNDVMADEGAPAVAVESGEIVRVDDTDDGNGGLSLWLRGDSGVAYYYAHNSQNLAAQGQRVARGEMIARVGKTGNARTTPPHIHFQINVCGELSSAEPCTVDPHRYLRRWAQSQIDGGVDGVGWYEPAAGAFGLRTEVASPLASFPFGAAGSTEVAPVAGDWDGDGRDSVGTYQRTDATFHLRDDEGAPLVPLVFGEPGRADVWPVAGDFDGDGRDTVGLYRQADATFVVMVTDGAESTPVALGAPGRTDALPVVGDWDGDGRDAIGVYQRTDGSLLLLDDDGTALPALPPTDIGAAGPDAFPVTGDWDVLPVAGDWNGRDLVTLDELRQIYGSIPDEAAVAEGLPALNAAMARAGITTPARKAAFLATLRNESGFRSDAVEAGNDSRYRGRGFIQLTGEYNYRRAGEDLGLDLAGDPDLAIGPVASPAIAAWYWTVARDINDAADELDMAAVNRAVGYAPSVARDVQRCRDFEAALRFYTGRASVEGVNCVRTPPGREE